MERVVDLVGVMVQGQELAVAELVAGVLELRVALAVLQELAVPLVLLG
jgi:hypothetical protein